MKEHTLALQSCSYGKHQLTLDYSYKDLSFCTTYWYGNVDLFELQSTYGENFMRNIFFHIAAFDINKIASLRPARLEWGQYQDLVTPEFATLWRDVFWNVWGQWRYENDDPYYEGPKFDLATTPALTGPTRTASNDVELLHFCGGGKDSLVAMKLLERGNIDFDSLIYSSSIYGLSAIQMDLLEGLLAHGRAKTTHKQWIYDSFLDSPVLELNSHLGISTITAAETPSSVFAALPYVLQHGYKYLVLGHERSADTGQVMWEKTNEDINHQWGKSYEAEIRINSYIQEHLIPDVSYFSILKPIYDVLIFNLLRSSLEAVPFTHSCNISKPWCKTCPKCAYVWLNYMAWLPVEMVNSMFDDTNLFDLEENIDIFIQLLGVHDQLPFECIGQRDESRLAFEMCRRKGVTGAAMDKFVSMNLEISMMNTLDKYLSISPERSGVPHHIFEKILPQLQGAKEDTLNYVSTLTDS